MPARFFNFSPRKGFTLIELLVVIAVIGVLATIILLAVNPAEQLARARDTSRITAVTQLGRTLQGYYTAGGSYPTDGSAGVVATDWMGPIVTSGDLKTRPANPNWGSTTPNGSGITCAPQFQENQGGGASSGAYCYATGTVGNSAEAIVYARLESSLNYSNKCAGVLAWSVFSTQYARAGVYCKATEPTVATLNSDESSSLK